MPDGWMITSARAATTRVEDRRRADDLDLGRVRRLGSPSVEVVGGASPWSTWTGTIFVAELVEVDRHDLRLVAEHPDPRVDRAELDRHADRPAARVDVGQVDPRLEVGLIGRTFDGVK